MCGEVVAAPLSLQDTVYPILRKSHYISVKNQKVLETLYRTAKNTK